MLALCPSDAFLRWNDGWTCVRIKTFPILYLFYFLRKRDLKVFAGGVTGALTSGAISIYVFGWELNRTYLLQVMPSALLGEGSDPYNLQAASLSSLLHRFFIYEP
ncbi:hypothetical protein HDF14_003413 [Edaphobacter lichenicola]|uniref:Uncharacterized protein n=1 Tax=Tunturiibacter gelidiferens TaxID=3069689 RepID=A0A9X0QG26_9BACT|nr:hypothetical protein [Edaphobacter lichenicola]